MPAAAACVSVGELSEAEGLAELGPRELRAMRIWGGFMAVIGRGSHAWDNVARMRRRKWAPEDTYISDSGSCLWAITWRLILGLAFK